jgi:hypothetical protein
MIKKQIRKCKHAVAILARSPESDFQHLRMEPFMSGLCWIGDVNVGRVSTVSLVIAGFPTCFFAAADSPSIFPRPAISERM